MGLFGTNYDLKELSESHTRLLTQIAELKAEIAGLRREKEDWASVNRLEEEKLRLEQKIVQLEVQKSKSDEANERKVRETEHLVGLQRKKQEFDVASARREAILEVREENLQADKDRFKNEMEFQRTHLKGEVDRVEAILNAVLKRLPNLNATLALSGGSQDEGGE